MTHDIEGEAALLASYEGELASVESRARRIHKLREFLRDGFVALTSAYGMSSAQAKILSGEDNSSTDS